MIVSVIASGCIFYVFNVLGESGLGKSTLVNSLFLTDLYSDRNIPPVSGLFKYHD